MAFMVWGLGLGALELGVEGLGVGDSGLWFGDPPNPRYRL